jgi:hypothetical protein
VRRLKKGAKASAPLPSPHERHGPSVQIQNHREIAMSFADGYLVDGDAPEFLEVRPAIAPHKASLLDILDHVPTHPQMMGHVPDRHVPTQLQGIPFERPGIGSTTGGKSYPDLPDHIADQTENPLHAQIDPRRVLPDGNGSKPPPYPAPANHMLRPAMGTHKLFGVPADREVHSTSQVAGANELVAFNPKSVVQKRRGHGGPPL